MHGLSDKATLNLKSEFFANCFHRQKILFGN